MKKTIGYFFVGATMLISAATISSCSKDDDADPVLPPIGGYSSSDSVAASNLIAKWSFENNLTESKSGLPGVGTAVNYSAGVNNLFANNAGATTKIKASGANSSRAAE